MRVHVTRLLLLALLLAQLAPMGMSSAQGAYPWGPGDICVSHEDGESSPTPLAGALEDCCGMPCCGAGMALALAMQLPLPLYGQSVSPSVPVGDDPRMALAERSSHQPRAPPTAIVAA